MKKGSVKSLNFDIPDIPNTSQHDYDSWKQPTGWFDWPKPYALGLGKWDEWETDFKAKYPIRFFFRETVPEFFSYNFKFRLNEYKWWILHRIHPKHRYHIVKTGLKPNYYDPDGLILHASFRLLCDYVEHNTKYDTIDWEVEEKSAAAWKEMNELVEWYKARDGRDEEFRKKRPDPGEGLGVRDLNKDTPEGRAYKEYIDEYMRMEELWAKEDEDNLIRLIILRPFLWYA